MSPAQAHKIIEAYILALNASDHDALLALLHEDVIHDINQGGREIGVEQFQWFLGMRARHYDEQLGDVAIMVDEHGTRAAAEFTVRGKYIATADGLPEAKGQSYTLPAGIFFTLEDKKITRVSAHYNLKDWIAQVS